MANSRDLKLRDRTFLYKFPRQEKRIGVEEWMTDSEECLTAALESAIHSQEWVINSSEWMTDFEEWTTRSR